MSHERGLRLEGARAQGTGGRCHPTAPLALAPLSWLHILDVNLLGRVLFIAEVLIAFLTTAACLHSAVTLLSKGLCARGGGALGPVPPRPGGRCLDLCHTWPPNVPLSSWAAAAVTRIPWLLASSRWECVSEPLRV